MGWSVNTPGIILQGFFPGGRPHSSVLLNIRNDYLSKSADDNIRQIIQRHPNNFLIQQKQVSLNRENNISQCLTSPSNIKTYPVNISKLNLRDEGSSLNDDVLQFYNNIFGRDFSDVVIHQGDGSAETTGALAFTCGKDIYFASGRFNPSSNSSLKLLGHELAHVVQQKEGRVKKYNTSNPVFVDDPILEAEAEWFSQQVNTLIQDFPLAKNFGFEKQIQLKKNKKKFKGRRITPPDFSGIPFLTSSKEQARCATLTVFDETFHDKPFSKGTSGSRYEDNDGFYKFLDGFGPAVFYNPKTDQNYLRYPSECAEAQALHNAYFRDKSKLPDLAFKTYLDGHPHEPCTNCKKWLSYHPLFGWMISETMLDRLRN